jgi:predicted Zn-dependent peptidase
MRLGNLAVLMFAVACINSASLHAQTAPQYHRLPNGLRVVLSVDSSAPLARIGVYYRVGSVNETPGREGFAHFFEHFMFEGSDSIKPGEFFDMVVSNGGRFGARTLYDFTKYNATVPTNALKLMLWAEADRMRNLRFDSARFENVRSVVKNEVRQQAFDRPYGRFVWIDMREAAFTKWQNSHSIYGDTPDGKMAALDAATLKDARQFFETYYVPDNAVLVVHGAIDPATTLQWIRQYFGNIPRGKGSRTSAPAEPRRTRELRASSQDRNANDPGLAVAYHMPPRKSPDFWTMGVINQLLGQGRDAWLHEYIVNQRALNDVVYTEISPRHGTMYTVGGPTLWAVYVIHDRKQSADTILAAIDQQISRLQSAPVDEQTLQRAITKALADFYGEWEAGRGDGRTDLLGQFALFDDDPGRINHIEAEFKRTTPARVQAVAREYLRLTNRVVLILKPKEISQ